MENKIREPKAIFHARISASAIAVLGPIIQHAQNYAWSMEAHCNQVASEALGLYIEPAPEGARLMVYGHAYFASFIDHESEAESAYHLHLPDDLINKCHGVWTKMEDENGQTVEVQMHPIPKWLECLQPFGLLLAERLTPAQKDFPAVGFGCWHNGDHGNVRVGDTYRMEEHCHSSLLGKFKILQDIKYENAGQDISVDLGLFSLFGAAARRYRMGYTIRMGSKVQPIIFESSDRRFFLAQMPLAELEAVND